MAKKVALDMLIDEFEMLSDVAPAYLDCDAGKVVTIDPETARRSEQDEPEEWKDWQREDIEVLREIQKGSKRYVRLPSERDVHEWDIMRRFCDTVGDDRQSDRLVGALRGSGAFRRFKSELDRSGLFDRWIAFKRDALRELAIEWCEENNIPFER